MLRSAIIISFIRRSQCIKSANITSASITSVLLMYHYTRVRVINLGTASRHSDSTSTQHSLGEQQWHLNILFFFPAQERCTVDERQQHNAMSLLFIYIKHYNVYIIITKNNIQYYTADEKTAFDSNCSQRSQRPYNGAYLAPASVPDRGKGRAEILRAGTFKRCFLGFMSGSLGSLQQGHDNCDDH